MSIRQNWFRYGSLLVAVGVLVVSSWPSLSVSAFGWSLEDKFQHLTVYALLSYLAARGWVPPRGAPGRKRVAWIILVILAIFAMLDEYHQRWIPGRFVELGDFLADALGVLAGFFLGLRHNRADEKSGETPGRMPPVTH